MSQKCSISSSPASAASSAPPPSQKRNRQALRDDFTARSSRHRQQVVRLSARLRKTEWARLLVFLAMPTLAWHGYENGFAPWLWLAFGGCLALFVALVRRHAGLRERIAHQQHRDTLNQWALARLDRRFDDLPACPTSLRPLFDKQDLDINLFGPASLGQLLFSQSTSLGDERIAAWLTLPATTAQQAERQEAIAELVERRSLRQALAAHALQINARGYGLGRLAAWVVRVDAGVFPPAQVVLGLLATLASLGGVVAVLAGVVPPLALLACIVVNLMFYGWRAKAWHKVFDGADDTADALGGLSDWLALAVAQRFDSPGLSRQVARLQGDGRAPAAAIRQLDGILGYARLRHNPTVSVFAQALLLWDFHCARALARWKREQCRRLPEWLEVVAELEALAAFAGLADENPGWCRAEAIGEAEIHAEAASHPLIHPERAVANPIDLVPGRVTVITGSNMSGKTTYMRTVALNLRLAQAGSVVAARHFAFGRMRMVSSISVSDSLEQGLSYFMSEVMQVKAVIDTVRQAAEPVLYLLDELLKGTNEKERNLAIIEILRTLCAHQALGMLTTHNVALATAPELQGLGSNIYFEEGFEEGEAQVLRFNYQLRHGISRNTNAIRLLRSMGVLKGD
ncbi:MutS-related protein [Pseudomonas soli]|uniref:MutS-related protein n=1 Tax=Pseudomonas soli TaxID=1306993 RepID=UPI00382BA81C